MHAELILNRERIFRLRVERGMTLTDVYQKTGIPIAHLSRIENGKQRGCTLRTLGRLSLCLHTEPESLLKWSS